MHLRVPFELVMSREPLLAKDALKGTLPGVDAVMAGEVVRAVEGLGAEGAVKGATTGGGEAGVGFGGGGARQQTRFTGTGGRG